MEFIFGLILMVGVCAIAGMLTSKWDYSDQRDNIYTTLARGCAVVMGLGTAVGMIGGILYLIFS